LTGRNHLSQVGGHDLGSDEFVGVGRVVDHLLEAGFLEIKHGLVVMGVVLQHDLLLVPVSHEILVFVDVVLVFLPELADNLICFCLRFLPLSFLSSLPVCFDDFFVCLRQLRLHFTYEVSVPVLDSYLAVAILAVIPFTVIVTATEASVLYFDPLSTRITRDVPVEQIVLWSLCRFEELFVFLAKLGLTPCDNF